MSSLLENHLIELSPGPTAVLGASSCWERLGCANVLCPAHGKVSADCWLIPKTHCTHFIVDDYFHKLSCCLTCSYFKARGKIHPKGWNYFVAEQMHRYNVKALERIYQKEESFVEILNRLPDGLFTTDKEWRITYFNPAAEKITGFSAYDAVGMYCKDVFKNTICESDCALKRAVAEGKDIHNREYSITNIDGRKIPIICSTSAFQDSAGRMLGGLEIFKDVSDVRRLQKEVLRREKKYRRVFEGSHDMIYATNHAGRIMDINPAGVDLLGYKSKEELVGSLTAANLYFNPADRARFLEIITRQGAVKDYEAKFKKRDGSPLQVLISSRRYENPKTGDIEYEGIIKDMTRRLQSEQELRERNRELSILNSIAVALNHSMDLNNILRTTLDNVLKALRLKRGALFLIDADPKKVRLHIASGLPRSASPEKNSVIFKDRMLGEHLLRKGFYFDPEPTFPPFMARYNGGAGLKNPWLTCFLITFRGKAPGFFGLDIPEDRHLSRHEFHLMGSLGNFLGGAIENTQLMETIRRHRQDLRLLTEKLFLSQEEERRRIARELHDEAGQSLTAVKLGLDRLEEKFCQNDGRIRGEVNEIRNMVRRTASEIRRLSFHLHPTLLIDLGLEPALNLYFKEIEKHSGLDIEFSMIGFDQRLKKDIETVLYRFSQETLTNTLKHSGAETFRLSIIKSYPRIIFLAEDDGVGFDAEIIARDKRSLGLLGMRERVSLFGGSFHLRSPVGEGTRIRIEIPFTKGKYHGQGRADTAG